MAENGESLPVIGKVLNHKAPAATSVYAHISDGRKREALKEHAKRVVKAIGGNESGN